MRSNRCPDKFYWNDGHWLQQKYNIEQWNRARSIRSTDDLYSINIFFNNGFCVTNNWFLITNSVRRLDVRMPQMHAVSSPHMTIVYMYSCGWLMAENFNGPSFDRLFECEWNWSNYCRWKRAILVLIAIWYSYGRFDRSRWTAAVLSLTSTHSIRWQRANPKKKMGHTDTHPFNTCARIHRNILRLTRIKGKATSCVWLQKL